MSRPVEIKPHTEAGKVEHGGIMLKTGRYDGQIFFPVAALPLIVEAVNKQESGT